VSLEDKVATILGGGPRVFCVNCGDTITSFHGRDFKYCSCKTVYVDGGKECPRIGGNLEAAIELPMQIDEYQRKSRATVAYPRVQIIIDDGEPIEAPWIYPLLGLCGETGELAEKFKKLLRDHKGEWSPGYHDLVIKELGDVSWYWARVADAIKVESSLVLKRNLKKLFSRLKRGKLLGSGDER